ncbi:MAG: T9SS type A sorting domain-containing protein [Flavobacteriales bacterium]|nr:T9SS type A sorting domain-containing protein [Flavobacteriales bacterium]
MDEIRTAVTFAAYDSIDHQNDKVCRLDFYPTGEAVRVSVPFAYDPLPMKYNFYETYTPQGVTNVTGSQRIIYPNIYSKIDYHILSDRYGPKFLYVVRPGGNPDDLLLRFEGQDSLDVDVDGMLRLYMGTKQTRLNQGMAYQQVGNTIVPVTWVPSYENQHGSALVSFDFGAFDPTKPLIIQVTPLNPAAFAPPPPPGPTPEWCTHVPGAGQEDFISDLAEGENGYIYYTGHSKSATGLPVNGGQVVQPFLFPSNFDAIVGKFNQYYETTADGAAWMTYYGNNGPDKARSLAYDPVNGRVAICGLSESVQTALNFENGLPTSDRNDGYGMLAVLDAATGAGLYGTRFPTYLVDLDISDVDYDASGNLYVVGGANLVDWGAWPFVDPTGTADYYSIGYPQAGLTFRNDGFVMRFNSLMERTYSTALGGPQSDAALSCKVDDLNNVLYVGGYTSTANDLNVPDCPSNGWLDFPICGAGGFIKDRLNEFNDGAGQYSDGFIVKFSIPTMHMDWSSYLGSSLEDRLTDLEVDGLGNVYAVGYVKGQGYCSTPCSWVNSSLFPQCGLGQYFEPYDGLQADWDHYICRFDSNTDMTWSTMIQGSRDESYYSLANIRVSCDVDNNVFLQSSTVSGSVATDITAVDLLANASYYSQTEHGDEGFGVLTNFDVYIAGFSPAGSLFYSSYLGDPGSDWAGGLEAINGRLYTSGATTGGGGFPIHAPLIPGHTPYCLAASALNAIEGYLAQLEYDATVGVDDRATSPLNVLQLFPNPVEDQLTVQWHTGGFIQSISIYDLTGRMVLEHSGVNAGICTLATGGLASGMYTVSVRTGTGLASARFIKR